MPPLHVLLYVPMFTIVAYVATCIFGFIVQFIVQLTCSTSDNKSEVKNPKYPRLPRSVYGSK